MEHLEEIKESLGFMPPVVVILTALGGALYCFAGYKCLRFLIGLTGFLLAGAAAAGIALVLSQGNHLITAVAGILGGISGVFALFFLYRAGIFLLGLVAALLITQGITGDMTLAWSPWHLVIAAIAGGLLALALERFVLVLATASIGAWVCLGAMIWALFRVFIFDPSAPLEVDSPLARYLIFVWAGLTIAGASVQFAAYRPSPVRTPKAG